MCALMFDDLLYSIALFAKLRVCQNHFLAPCLPSRRGGGGVGGREGGGGKRSPGCFPEASQQISYEFQIHMPFRHGAANLAQETYIFF